MAHPKVGSADRYRVTRDYEAAYSDPLILAKGQSVLIQERESEWPDWRWCTAPSGRTGWVPKSYVIRDKGAWKAARNYDATELSVSKGQVLSAQFQESDWIWTIDEQGREGWVPLNHVEPLTAG